MDNRRNPNQEIDEMEFRNVKNLFNELMAMEPYSKDQIEDLFKSASYDEFTIVLIDFSAIEEGEENGEFIPGEMALSAFSLRSGISDNCSIIINHENAVPENTLKKLNRELELPSRRDKNHTYGNSIWILNSFRKKHNYGRGKNHHAPLFCRKSDYKRVTSCLDFLFKARGGDQFGYQVVPLEYLYLRLARLIYTIDNDSRKNSSDYILLRTLDSDDFGRVSRLACIHHHSSETGHNKCPLKRISVRAFNIIGSMVESRMAFPGTHYPSIGQGDQEIHLRHNQILAWAIMTQVPVSVPIPQHILDAEAEKRVREEALALPDPFLAPSMHSDTEIHQFRDPQYFKSIVDQLPARLPHNWNPKIPPPNVRPGLLPLPTSGQSFPYRFPPRQSENKFRFAGRQNPFYPPPFNAVNQEPGPVPPSSPKTEQNPMVPPGGDEDQKMTQQGNLGHFPNLSHFIPFPDLPPPDFLKYQREIRFSAYADASTLELEQSVENLFVESPTPDPSSQMQYIDRPKSPVKKHVGGRPG